MLVKYRVKSVLYSLTLIFFMFVFLGISFAQSSDFLTCVYIEPKIEGSGPKYSIEFRNTDVVGLILPADAEIIIYGNIEVASYNFRTEVETGSYKVTGELDKYNARIPDDSNKNVPAECSNVDPTTTLATRPFDVLPSDLIIITEVGRGNYDLNTLLGVASFHFAPPLPGFQIVQFKGQFIEFSLPYLSDPITDFTMMTNKNNVNLISLRTIQTPSNPVEVIRYIEPTYDYRTFINTLAAPAEAIELLRRINARIYPVSGRVSQYHQGDFIRLDMGNANPPNSRGFKKEDELVALPGADPVFTRSDGSTGVMNPVQDRFTIIDIVDGQLIVRNGRTGADGATVEDWLLELEPQQ